MKIKLTPDDFFGFVVSYLQDMIRYKERPEHMEHIISRMEDLGFKPIFMKYWLGMSAGERLKYKRIKQIFHGGKFSDGTGISFQNSKKETLLESTEEIKEKNYYKVKDIVKKVLIVSKKVRERRGFPLSEEIIDKIIENVMNKENGEK